MLINSKPSKKTRNHKKSAEAEKDCIKHYKKKYGEEDIVKPSNKLLRKNELVSTKYPKTDFLVKSENIRFQYKTTPYVYIHNWIRKDHIKYILKKTKIDIYKTLRFFTLKSKPYLQRLIQKRRKKKRNEKINQICFVVQRIKNLSSLDGKFLITDLELKKTFVYWDSNIDDNFYYIYGNDYDNPIKATDEVIKSHNIVYQIRPVYTTSGPRNNGFENIFENDNCINDMINDINDCKKEEIHIKNYFNKKMTIPDTRKKKHERRNTKEETRKVVRGIDDKNIRTDNYIDSEIIVPEKDNNTLGFIDLCSGVGGFHMAIENIKDVNSQCILASDIDKNCRKVYYKNHGIPVHRNLSNIDYSNIDFDIIFAGFPCQAFSVAGNRKGLDDVRGSVIFDIFKIIKLKKPKLVVLENVKGLKSMKNIDKNKNEVIRIYDLIKQTFGDLGYYHYDRVISPHEINIPQKRERLIIVAIRKDLVDEEYKSNEDFEKNRMEYVEKLIKQRKKENENVCIFQNDEEITKDYELKDEEENTLKLWKNFVKMKEWDDIDNIELARIYLKNIMNKTDEEISRMKKFRNFKQTHFFIDFQHFKNTNSIPPFLKNIYKRKSDVISKSIKKECDILNTLYDNSKKFKLLVDNFLFDNEYIIKNLRYKYRYLEYSGGENFGTCCNYDNFYVQFRMSGVRIRKSNYFPTLVKSGPLPVIIKKNRYLTVVECGRLQSFKKGFKFLSKSSAIKQTGNAVNTQVIELMIRSAFNIMNLTK
jgi:DNA (cytosine-5)-methyltransferase 1